MKPVIKIGVVHDDINKLFKLHNALSGEGYDVCVDATTVQQMIDSCVGQRPDLLVVKKGLWDAANLRLDQNYLVDWQVPVILLVGTGVRRASDVLHDNNVLAIVEESATQDNLIPVVELVVERCRQLGEMRRDISKLRQDLIQSQGGRCLLSQEELFPPDN